MPEVIKENYEFFRDLLWDDAEGYRVIKSTSTGNSRWHIEMETVFERTFDNKLFITYWRKGATEYQDHEYPEEAFEAEEYTVTATEYRAVPREIIRSQPHLPKCSTENFDND